MTNMDYRKINFDGFKVTYADGQFPTYTATREQANAVAGAYFCKTGKMATVDGFWNDRPHALKTWRKSSRT